MGNWLSLELAKYLSGASAELNRQIGVLITRSAISHVIVGDAKGVFLPNLK